MIDVENFYVKYLFIIGICCFMLNVFLEICSMGVIWWCLNLLMLIRWSIWWISFLL